MHRIRTGAVAGGAMLVISTAALAATPHGGTFAGSTSGQGRTIKNVHDRSFRFTVSGHRVSGLKVGFKATCASGTVDSDAVALHGSFRVGHGRFSGSGQVQDGGTGTVTGRFITSRRASGTIRMRPVIVMDGVEGGAIERCDSGLLHWTARLR